MAIKMLEGIDVLRKCSFNPADHFIDIAIDERYPDKKTKYLETKWRLFWFHVYCMEKGLNGVVIEEPATTVGDYIQVVAKVVIDGTVVGQGIGGGNASMGPRAIQSIATVAKGRALANAGFGPVFAAGANETGGAEEPCDGGITTAEFFHPIDLSAFDEDELPFTTEDPEPEQKPAAKKPRATKKQEPKPAEENAPVKEEPKPAITIPKTREEALDWVVPVGRFAGKKLGIAFAQSPNVVRYAATRMQPVSPEEEAYQAAAKLVCEI